jgi:hypothetical protein
MATETLDPAINAKKIAAWKNHKLRLSGLFSGYARIRGFS